MVASIVLEDVTVVDVERGLLLLDHVVILDGERIAWVGPAAEAPHVRGETVVDGAGGFVIPGLSDMHAHLPSEGDEAFDRQTYLDLQLEAGVTTVRSMRGDPSHAAVRDAIEGGTRRGPDLLLASVPVAQAVVSPNDAQTIVAKALREGADFIKLLGVGDIESYDNLFAAARTAGLPIAGHLPGCVSVEHAVEARQQSVEHLGGVIGTSDERAFQAFGSAEVFHCPTLYWYAVGLGVYGARHFDDAPAMRFVPAEVRAVWDKSLSTRAATGPVDLTPLSDRLTALRRLHEAGAPLLIGPDASGPYGLPGYAVHDEMALFAAAGIPAADVLRAATLNAAALQGRQDELGTVAAGKVANLVLLEQNPLDDIEAVRTVTMTIHRGRPVTP